MPITTAYSTKPLPAAVAELKAQCGSQKPRFVVCFASSKYDPAALSHEMQAAFPDAHVVGCTSAGEIVGVRMLTGSVVAMFFDDSVVEDVAVAVLEDIRKSAAVKPAFAEFERHFQAPVSSLDLDKHIGLVLVDGLSGAEEILMEKIGDRTDICFVGGAAGDDLRFKATHIMAHGRAYSHAAVLVLIRTKRKVEILKTQSFKLTGKSLLPTKVDEPSRKVIEFNDKPALPAYAEALGVSPEKAASMFMRHPLGLMAGGEPFVRSPQRVENGSIYFYCKITEGMELQVLEATDIVADTRAALESKKMAMGHVSGVIDFHCILRTLELRNENRCDAYGAIFEGVPTVGLSTYGEEYLGHINQTSTMLLFG